MSSLGGPMGWDVDMPCTLAINRYAAGWIDLEAVALHVIDEVTYTLSKPRGSGYQFLVIHSGHVHAFTTLEVLEERSARFVLDDLVVYAPTAAGNRRARRFEGVLVRRYDQSAGTGVNARFGPAWYDERNPDYLIDVGWGRDDYSLLSDGETRDIGGSVRIDTMKNRDGTWDVTVSGGRVADFERWCSPVWFSGREYDAGCILNDVDDD